MKFGLVSDVDRLLADQAAAWPALHRGLEGLQSSLTRAEKVFGREVLVRHIPHRMRSTTAAVDAASVARRPCFLCRENLDPEESGIAFDSEFTLYCNPFPILERHLTIVHSQHRPQRIDGQYRALLRLAEALPDSFVIYNGPQCGASAPDHLHFQACSRAVFPVGRDAGSMPAPGLESYIPRTFVLRGTLDSVAATLGQLLDVLAELTPIIPEPMVNIAAFFEDGRFHAFIFPRARHRPRVFETGELTVSPATIDLSGIVVVPVRNDFDKIRGSDIEAILNEVTVPPDFFNAVLRRLEHQL
jgi:hypothetical protein